jgi:hypothetical protein
MKNKPIDITKQMEACFGLIEIGREFSIQGFMLRGMTRSQAKEALYKQNRANFINKWETRFSSAFPELKVWG